MKELSGHRVCVSARESRDCGAGPLRSASVASLGCREGFLLTASVQQQNGAWLIGWTGSESVVLRKRLIEYRCQLPSTMSHTLSPPIPEGRAWRWLTCNTFPHEWTRPVESVECPCVFLMFAHEHSNKVLGSCLPPEMLFDPILPFDEHGSFAEGSAVAQLASADSAITSMCSTHPTKQEVWGCIGTASGKVIVWVVRVEEVTTLSSFYPSISHLNHATTMDRGAHAAAISGAWSVYLPFSWTCD